MGSWMLRERAEIRRLGVATVPCTRARPYCCRYQQRHCVALLILWSGERIAQLPFLSAPQA